MGIATSTWETWAALAPTQSLSHCRYWVSEMAHGKSFSLSLSLSHRYKLKIVNQIKYRHHSTLVPRIRQP